MLRIDAKVPEGIVQNPAMEVDVNFNTSKAITSSESDFSNYTSSTSTSSDEQTNSHFKVCITSFRKKYCILLLYSIHSFSIIFITKISDEFYLIRVI